MAVPGFLITLASLVLRLLSWVRNKLYDSGFKKGLEPPLLAISVGNIAFGGTGKTPLALFLLSFLRAEGWKPCLISRGYKGTWEKRGGLVSDGQRLLATWKEAGDEPFMVARRLPQVPVIVGRNRYNSCLMAVELGCNVTVLDDAFQHRQLKRHLDIVLLSSQDKAQRETWSALKRADLILVEGKKELLPAPAFKVLKSKKIPPPVFAYKLQPASLQILSTNEEVKPDKLKGKRVIAFCGLARPVHFRKTLQNLGALIERFLPFPDHYPYPEKALRKIAGYFEKMKPDWLITTEKDAVKIIDQIWFLSQVPVAVLKMDFVPESGFILVVKNFLEKRALLENDKVACLEGLRIKSL